MILLLNPINQKKGTQRFLNKANICSKETKKIKCFVS